MDRTAENENVYAADRFAGACSGMAATEFALLVPVLLTLFFGVVEGSDALATSRRVSLAANTLADLTAQESELIVSDADDLFDGVAQIVSTEGQPVTIRLVSVVADADGDPVVDWSRDNAGGAPYAKGAEYKGLPDNSVLDVNASIIVSEISYPYNSKLTHFLFPTMTFDKIATRWPRRALRVKLCSAPGVCGS